FTNIQSANAGTRCDERLHARFADTPRRTGDEHHPALKLSACLSAPQLCLLQLPVFQFTLILLWQGFPAAQMFRPLDRTQGVLINVSNDPQTLPCGRETYHALPLPDSDSRHQIQTMMVRLGMSLEIASISRAEIDKPLLGFGVQNS